MTRALPSPTRARRGPPRPLVGRDEVLESARRALPDARLLTLLGAPGVGKTALAATLGTSAGRTVFVDLSDTTAPHEVLGSVARAAGLGLPGADRASSVEALGQALDDTLVVLDGPEHVLDETALLVGRWLAVGRARFVVASRERLRLAEEQVLVVPPLDADAAATLFFRRAATHDATLVRTAATEAGVRRIVARLDGVPLALELAAAQLPLLSLEDLERELDTHTDRLRAHARNAPPRHVSLSHAIDLSLDRLSDDERTALARLSVLRGTFDLPAAAAVLEVGEARAGDLLRSLLDRSLLTPLAIGAGRRRFGVLAPIRARAAARAGTTELEAASHAHAAHFLDEAERADRRFESERDEALGALDDALDNLLAARAWLRPRDPARAARLGVSLFHYIDELALWHAFGSVLVDALEDARAAGDAALLARALCARAAGGAAVEAPIDRAASFSAALDHAKRCGDARLAVRAGAGVAAALGEVGRFEEARVVAQTALDGARALGNEDDEARALNNLAVIELAVGRLDAAIDVIERSLGLRRKGRAAGRASGLVVHAIARHARGEHALARALYQSALESDGALRFRVMAELLAASLVLDGDVLGRVAPLERQARELALPVSEGLALALRSAVALRGGDRELALSLALSARERLGPWVGYRDIVAPVLRASGVEAPATSSAYELIGRQWVGVGRRLRVGPEAAWLEAEGVRIELGRRVVLRRIIARLVEQAETGGPPLDVWALVETGWPGERIRPTAAPQRVYTSLDRLRGLGLAGYIERCGDGWRVASDVTLVRSA